MLYVPILCLSVALANVSFAEEKGDKEKPARDNGVLAPLDGKSHRGDKMVGDKATPEQLKELSRLYQGKGADAPRAHNGEYFLRLLDYYLFSKNRLVGMKSSEVAEIFGAHDGQKGDKESWTGGADTLVVHYENGIVKSTQYIMGF